MESFLNDLKHSLRILRQSPGFTIAAVGALALGIGANTAIFTVVNTVILHPLPYPEADRIVNISHRGGGRLNELMFNHLAQNNPGLDDLAAYQAGPTVNLNGMDRAERVEATAASQNYFRLFGAHPILGRTFTPAEDQRGGPAVLVMSYGLWQRRFAGEPSILGKSIALGGKPHLVIGVLSPLFHAYPHADVWTPLQVDPNRKNLAGILAVSGRLPRGVSLAQAVSRVAAAASRFEQRVSQFKRDPKLEVTPLQQHLIGDIRPALLILLGSVGLVLLIACANVGNLLLVRASARQKEFAIRAAMGATRGRIVRQLLTESLLLALAGGTVGLAIGSWAVRALLVLMPGDLPRFPEIANIPALDPSVAGFTFLMAVVTGVLFGLVPVFHLSRTELTIALNESGGRTGSGRKQNRTRGVLVAAEMAIAVVLLCGALLLIRSFAAMHGVNLGFDPHDLLTMEVSITGPGYSKSSDVERVALQFIRRAESIPGVASAAVASALPLFGKMDMIFNIPGRTPPEGRQFDGDVQWRFVSARYFDVLRIPLLSGRLLREQEPGRTMLVSQTMARKYWPDSNPVGQTIFLGPTLGPAYEVGITEIVGVVGDVRERLDIDPQPVMYQAPSQIPDADMAIVTSIDPTAVLVRTRSGVPPMSVSHAVQQALLAGDQLPAAKVRTMEQVGLDSTARLNFNLLLLALFAAIALLLATVGIYGVMSYSVEQRTHEIGIRAALGANRRDTLLLVLTQALRMAMAGVGTGIAASFGLTRLLNAQLFGVKSTDPLTFVALPLILLAVALSAAYIPALRATRIDPLTALRHE